jgi:hypothetical protein
MDRICFVPGLGSQVGDYFLDLLGKWATLSHSLLGSAHFGGRNQRHSVGHLAGVFHAPNSAPDVPYTGHCYTFIEAAASESPLAKSLVSLDELRNLR